MPMTERFFRFEAPSAPWGDYGDILVHGMTAHLGRSSEALVQLERTGPFIPPISFPGVGDVIVTAALSHLLNRSGLTGLGYVPVQKARIVRLDWHLWDRLAEEPVEYPEDGEPEGYILDRPHCADTASQLGVLWALRLDTAVTEIRRDDSIVVNESSWTGVDFFRGTETRYNYISARGRGWLMRVVPEFVNFVDVAVVS